MSPVPRLKPWKPATIATAPSSSASRTRLGETSTIRAEPCCASVTIPAWLPEKVCWAINDEYHAPFVEGGHVRIFTEAELKTRFVAAGLEPSGTHHAHALHSPYWWLKCAVGPTNDTNPAVKAYHRLLVWDISSAPKLTRWTEKVLNPVLGKSLVVYATKPVRARVGVAA